MYAIVNVSKKDLSNIIREFDKLPYEIYEKKRPKHYPTGNYFYLARHLVEFTMRVNALNFDNYPVRTEMTGTKQIPSLHICSTNEIELKEFLVNKTLSQVHYTD